MQYKHSVASVMIDILFEDVLIHWAVPVNKCTGGGGGGGGG